MTQLKIKSIIGTLVVLGVIVAWASGNKGPRDSGLMYNEDDVSNCPNSCQTRWVTSFGCLNSNQEDCTPYKRYDDWKNGTCVFVEGFGYYCNADDDDESDEGGDGGCGEDGCGSGCGDDDCYDGCY